MQLVVPRAVMMTLNKGRENTFENVENIFESVQNTFESVQNIFESVENTFESVQNTFESVQNIFESVSLIVGFVFSRKNLQPAINITYIPINQATTKWQTKNISAIICHGTAIPPSYSDGMAKHWQIMAGQYSIYHFTTRRLSKTYTYIMEECRIIDKFTLLRQFGGYEER